MINLATLGFAVICGLLGVKKQLLACWFAMWSVLFAVYVGVWSEPVTAKFINDLAPRVLGVWMPFAATLGSALIALIVLRQSLKYMKTAERKLEVPPLVDKLGSFACAFVTGFTVAAFAVFLVMLTPLRDRVPGREEAFDKSCARLLAVSARVNALSMQEFYAPDYRAMLDGMMQEADPPPPPPLKGAKDTKTTTTVAAEKK